uniref:Probable protein-export membrane protein SecG n=1 Tax=Inkyuleea mariana TaxID=123988 RepID=A0A4D6X195_9FLOR|nr:Preprotein-translocase subunit g [Inkyuleea mariana]
MKLIWYVISLATILLILINSPKASSIVNLGNQGKILNFTRNTQKRLQIITIINVLLFFLLTILLALSVSY